TNFRLVQVVADAGPQSVASPPPAPADSAESEVEVVSTKIEGLNRKSIFEASEEGALPYNVIDREEITRSGATTLEELFRNIPEFTNYGNGAQAPIGNSNVSFGVVPQTSAANLRGF